MSKAPSFQHALLRPDADRSLQHRKGDTGQAPPRLLSDENGSSLGVEASQCAGLQQVSLESLPSASESLFFFLRILKIFF